VFRDERELESAAKTKRHLLADLQSWLAAQTHPLSRPGLAELDALAIWHNLPVELQAMTPLHRLRTVIRCLQARAV